MYDRGRTGEDLGFLPVLGALVGVGAQVYQNIRQRREEKKAKDAEKRERRRLEEERAARAAALRPSMLAATAGGGIGASTWIPLAAVGALAVVLLSRGKRRRR